jgi:mono/diheme cytochrome c family protein
MDRGRSVTSVKHTRHRMAVAGLIVLIWFAALGSTARLQTTGSTIPPLVIKSLDGRDLFRFYCATCHGATGTGDGPAASALKNAPPNLTLLARSGGGLFPRERIRATIAGDDSAKPASAHGSREMPVWGPIFRALDPDDRYAAVRIDNLVKFLESIQVK